MVRLAPTHGPLVSDDLDQNHVALGRTPHGKGDATRRRAGQGARCNFDDTTQWEFLQSIWASSGTRSSPPGWEPDTSLSASALDTARPQA